MNTGTYISGIGHVLLIAWVLFGGLFHRSQDTVSVKATDVSIISEEEFAALTRPQAPPVNPEPIAIPTEPTSPQSEDSAVPEPATEKPPESPEPPQAETPPAGEENPVVEGPPTPPPTEQVDVPEPPSDTPTPRAAPRIAETPTEPVPPETQPSDTVSEEVTPDPTAETPKPETDATAPPETTTRTVTEADTPASSAPIASIRPVARPQKSARPAPQKPPAEDDATAAAIAAAVSEANDTPAPQTETPRPASPSGPPLSRGEKDALRVAVSSCWNVGSLSSDALRTTVVVAVSLSRDGKPKPGSIRMLSSSGGSAGSEKQAFDAARRAILRCGARGYKLPSEKYDRWRDIEITFNPEKMRIK